MRHEHDCTCCNPLGQVGEYDLYFCMQGGDNPTVIARYGRDGDYMSGINTGNEILQIAQHIARVNGLIDH